MLVKYEVRIDFSKLLYKFHSLAASCYNIFFIFIHYNSNQCIINSSQINQQQQVNTVSISAICWVLLGYQTQG